MNEETRKILDLLAQGKITVDEAGQLLAAIGQSREQPPKPGGGQSETCAEKPAVRFLRVEVNKAANERRPEKQVAIRIPISLARSGMRLGAIINGFGGDQLNERLRERGIDLSKLDGPELEGILRDLGEVSVDIDQGKAQVRITCE